MKLNLARWPFVNLRPITRLALVAWLLGAALAVWNVRQAWTLWRGLGAEGATLEEARGALAAERQRLAEIERELRGIDLVAENERALFLDREVERRVFSWTHLFERLGRVLPREVRLVQVRPLLVAPGQPRGRGTRTAAAASRDLWVTLQVSGFAERDEALLDLVDALFADPVFDAPDLKREAVPPGRPVQFELEVRYLPAAASPQGGAGDPAGSLAAAPPRAAGRAEAAAAGEADLPGRDGVPALAGAPVAAGVAAGRGVARVPGSGAVPAAASERTGVSAGAPPAAAAPAPRRDGPAGVRAAASEPITEPITEPATEPAARPALAMRPRGGGEALAPGFLPVPLGDPASATRRIVP